MQQLHLPIGKLPYWSDADLNAEEVADRICDSELRLENHEWAKVSLAAKDLVSLLLK